MASSSRLAIVPMSPVRARLTAQLSTAAVRGSVTYQATSTDRLHSCPRCAGPRSDDHQGSGT
ncbi:hypothetical protein BJF79_26255 [Actinomadura sp. CNU-125]|nr:hypothetical protein BJF79_26255 [Actinomadura sp. CNU-125]